VKSFERLQVKAPAKKNNMANNNMLRRPNMSEKDT
jgi:hypothetical protein